MIATPSTSAWTDAPDRRRHQRARLRAGADARGNLAFDAVIVAICRESGVTSLLTEDRDFDRLRGFATHRLARVT